MNTPLPANVAAELDALFRPSKPKPKAAPTPTLHAPAPTPAEPMVKIKSADDVLAAQGARPAESDPEADDYLDPRVPDWTPGSTSYSAKPEPAAYIERSTGTLPVKSCATNASHAPVQHAPTVRAEVVALREQMAELTRLVRELHERVVVGEGR